MRFSISDPAVRRFAIEHSIPYLLAPLITVVIGAAILHDRRPVIDADTLQGRAIPQLVAEAGELTIEWTARRYRACATTIAREIVDSANVVYRLDQSIGPYSTTTNGDTWRMSITIPPGAAWGRARYRSTISYHCGWTHSWWPLTVKSPEVPFEIVPLPQKRIEELRG